MSNVTDHISTTDNEVRHKLQVQFDLHECQFTPEALADMADDLDPVARQVGDFPVADARVLIEWNGRNNEYAVKLTLILPNEVLVTSHHDGDASVALQHAVSSLQHAVGRYKEQLGQVADRRRAEAGTRQEVTPVGNVDLAALDAAAAAADYPAFRQAVAPYEDGLRLRVGRWVERYPEFEARIGRGLQITDLVEGVLLAAFEKHPSRPADERYGEWLETLIDAEVRAFAHDPDGELENVNMARAACAAAQ